MTDNITDSNKRAALALHNIGTYSLPLVANHIGRVVRMLDPRFGVVPGDTETTDDVRRALSQWHENVYGGDTPLGTLVWHEIDAALRGDDEAVLHNAYAALRELQQHRVNDVPEEITPLTALDTG